MPVPGDDAIKQGDQHRDVDMTEKPEVVIPIDPSGPLIPPGASDEDDD